VRRLSERCAPSLSHPTLSHVLVPCCKNQYGSRHMRCHFRVCIRSSKHHAGRTASTRRVETDCRHTCVSPMSA
jgi:hypothetical protein